MVRDVCLGNFNKPTTFASFKTTLIDSHRETIFKPCSNVFKLKNDISKSQLQANVSHFQADDNETGLAADDREFMDLSDKSSQKDQDGRWKSSPVITKQSSSSI